MAVFDIGAGALEEAYLEFGLEAYLHQLPTVRILTVCTYMLQVLPLELESSGVTPFFGMAHLTLRTAMLSCEQKGIQYLLRSNYPCLQVLIIQIVPQRIVDLDESERDDVEFPVDTKCTKLPLCKPNIESSSGERLKRYKTRNWLAHGM